MNLISLKHKIFYLVGKAILTAVNSVGTVGFYDTGSRAKPQRLSMNWFGNLTDIEHSQPYGFETYPVVGTSKAILLSPDGSRSNAFVIMVQDDTYRPDDLREGETCQYDNSNARISCYDGKVALGNPDQTLTSTPSGGKAEAMEIIDRLFTLLQSDVNLGGAASGTKLITALPELLKLQTDWNKIKGSF